MEQRRLERILQESGDRANPGPAEIAAIVRDARTFAVVGISRDPMKDARRVPSYLAAKGAEIIPVNPNATRILGRSARATLDEVREAVDVVLIFRPSGEVAPFIREAAARPERPVIWLPEGVRDDQAAGEARSQGRTVVQDLCIYKVHRALAEARQRSTGRI